MLSVIGVCLGIGPEPGARLLAYGLFGEGW